MTVPDVVTISLEAVSSLDVSRWTVDEPHRLDVLTEHTALPFLVVPRAGAQAVVVLNNGAVDHSIAQGCPVFQRSSWSPEIRHHQIYFCDPGTVGEDRLSLAWGQVNRDHWAVYDAGRAIKAISEALGVHAPEQRVYYGSSAGGFMALALLAGDAGASAIVNNAQFDWTRWMASGLNPLREARFDNMLPLHLRVKHPIRTNVLNLLVKRNRPVRVDYYVNLASKHDREVDHPMFETFIRSFPGLTGDVRVLSYENEEADHNPLPKDRTLALLNQPFPSPSPRSSRP